MDASRTIIIGDVHGCLEELKLLLDKVEYDSLADRLIFVGDLINKGPDSIGVLKYVKSLNAEVVMGNHDYALIHRKDMLEDLREKMGEELSDCVEYIESFPTYIEDKEFIVVHAGLVPGQHPSESTLKNLTEIRTWDGLGEDLQNKENPPWYEFYKGEKLVVFGHWARLG